MTEKQQRVQELTRQIAEMKRELKEIEPNSSKKMLLTTVGIIVGTIIAVACFMCFFPLSDDDSVYNASCAVHDAKAELREYRAFHGESIDDAYLQCDAGCAKCHPLTWRLYVRCLRLGFF
jgi:hypothetical protein